MFIVKKLIILSSDDNSSSGVLKFEDFDNKITCEAKLFGINKNCWLAIRNQSQILYCQRVGVSQIDFDSKFDICKPLQAIVFENNKIVCKGSNNGQNMSYENFVQRAGELVENATMTETSAQQVQQLQHNNGNLNGGTQNTVRQSTQNGKQTDNENSNGKQVYNENANQDFNATATSRQANFENANQNINANGRQANYGNKNSNVNSGLQNINSNANASGNIGMQNINTGMQNSNSQSYANKNKNANIGMQNSNIGMQNSNIGMQNTNTSMQNNGRQSTQNRNQTSQYDDEIKKTQKVDNSEKAIIKVEGRNENGLNVLQGDGGQSNGAGLFFDEISDQLDQLFETYPEEKELELIVPQSRWVRVPTEDRNFYVVGVVFDEKSPQFICYGVPDKNRNNPPNCKQQARQWLELELNGRGYWMMYQDAKTGQTLQATTV